VVFTEKRLRLVKKEGHVLCHTKVTAEETAVCDNLRFTHIHKGKKMTTLIMAADKIGFVSLADWFKRLAAKIEYNSKVRATIKELSALSDAELRDIGLTRCDIHSVAHESYLDDRGAW